MNFIAKLVGKCFRYFMLFALVLIGFESVNVFLQGQASFFELLATLAMLYLIYKFLVPLAERFLVFLHQGKCGSAAAAGSAETSGRGGALCRQHRKSGERLDHGLQRSGLQLRSGSQAGGK